MQPAAPVLRSTVAPQGTDASRGALIAGHVSPRQVMPPLAGSPWRYRRKARLGARYVAGRYGALVGFRERLPNRVADMTDCEVLADAARSADHAVAASSWAHWTPWRGFRRSRWRPAKTPPSSSSAIWIRSRRTTWRRSRGSRAGTGSGSGCSRTAPTPPGRSSIRRRICITPSTAAAIRLSFSPLDFVQVNAEVNRALVRRVVSMVDPAPGGEGARRLLRARQLQPAARGPRGGGDRGWRPGRTWSIARVPTRPATRCPQRFHRADLGDEAVGAGLAGPRMGQAAHRPTEVRGRSGGRARPPRARVAHRVRLVQSRHAGP